MEYQLFRGIVQIHHVEILFPLSWYNSTVFCVLYLLFINVSSELKLHRFKAPQFIENTYLCYSLPSTALSLDHGTVQCKRPYL